MKTNTPSDVSLSPYNSRREADVAIQSLKKFGVDAKKESLIGKGYHSEEHRVGFYTTATRSRPGEPMELFGAVSWAY